MSTVKEIFEPMIESFNSKRGLINLPSANNGLSRKQKSFLDQAMRMAETSDVEQNRHGAVIVKGGRVLARGANSWRNKAMLNMSAEEVTPEAITVHAEIDALNRISDPSGVTVYVARMGKNGDSKFSRPCDRCTIALAKAGVKQVVYTV